MDFVRLLEIDDDDDAVADDEEEEGGLEFDLEDFLDDDEPKKSGSVDASDIDLDLGD